MSQAWREDDWRSHGACLSADPDLFFPITVAGPAAAQLAQAKEVCAPCVVRAECLSFALARRDVQGIWGGTTDSERRELRGEPARTVRQPARTRSAA